MNFHKNNKNIIILVLVLIVIAIAGKQLDRVKTTPSVVEEQPVATTTSTTPEPVTHSDGTITFEVPENYGLAVTKDQILVKSYIPPCDDDFDYCIYNDGTEYSGTNFGSAGIRIKNRTDLKTVATCLNASPASFPGSKSTVVASTTDYILSSFPGIGDAGMGHYAAGALFRLAYDGTCHEFETRVSATQFLNYPEGTIKEFTGAENVALQAKLKAMVENMSLKNGEKLSF